MKYEVCVEAPQTASLKGSGRWVVEADSRDEALGLVMTNGQAKWWPQGSTWKICDGNSKSSSQQALSFGEAARR